MSAARGDRLGRIAALAGIALIVGSLVGLGLAWRADRRRVVESPRWDPALFVRLREPRPAWSDTGETWTVIVHPGCPRCLRVLESLARAGGRGAGAAHLAALIVDEPARPGPALLVDLPASQVWWDSAGVWRRRWGLRLYGGVLRFDAAGRFRGHVPDPASGS